MATILDRALNAKRASRRIGIRSNPEVGVLLRDVAAIANSGRGAIVLRDTNLGANDVIEKI